jgi:hypothetical protein
MNLYVNVMQLHNLLGKCTVVCVDNSVFKTEEPIGLNKFCRVTVTVTILNFDHNYPISC